MERLLPLFYATMAEGLPQQEGNSAQSEVQISSEIERHSCDASAEKMILQECNVPFTKIPVQNESSQSKSLTSSDNYSSSPVFKPRSPCQRSGCLGNEKDEPMDTTSLSDKDGNHMRQFRRRTNAFGAKSMHKRKKVS